MFGSLLKYRNPYSGNTSTLDLNEFVQLVKGFMVFTLASAAGTWAMNAIRGRIAAAQAARVPRPAPQDADTGIIVNG